MIPHLSNHSNNHLETATEQQSLSYIKYLAIPGIFERSFRPSSSYSLDSDPILSILTLVASEGGSQGGKRREGEGRERGKGREAKEREGRGGKRREGKEGRGKEKGRGEKGR